MHNADLLSTISNVFFGLAGLFFILSAVSWFVFKIPSVISDLSGRNIKKAISEIRRTNEGTGIKVYKTSKANALRTKLTEEMQKVDTDTVEELVAATKMEIGEETEFLDKDIEKIHTIEKNQKEINIEMLEDVMIVHTSDVI